MVFSENGEHMTPTPTPAPGPVPYEANPTVTNEETGAVQHLNATEYATEACCQFVANWLNSDPRTAPSGPFKVVSTNESVFPWAYSIPLRQIEAPNGVTFDAGLWYNAIQNGGADLDAPIAELVADAALEMDEEDD
jgi:hypothetical protein